MKGMMAYCFLETADYCREMSANSIALAWDQTALLQWMVKISRSWRKKRSPVHSKHHNRGRSQTSKPSYYSLLIVKKYDSAEKSIFRNTNEISSRYFHSLLT